MMIPVARRFVLAVVAWVFAWMLLHRCIASALCVRGDEFLRKGEPRDAQRYYKRALRVDPDFPDAVERFTFSSLELRTARDLAAAVQASDAYLDRHRSNDEIARDRALVLWASGDEPRAAVELRSAGTRLHDGRLLRLAAIADRRVAEAVLQ